MGKTAEEFLSAAISEMDADILSAKKDWKPDGLTVKERNAPRTLTTSLGELRYKRTNFSLSAGMNIVSVK